MGATSSGVAGLSHQHAGRLRNPVHAGASAMEPMLESAQALAQDAGRLPVVEPVDIAKNNRHLFVQRQMLCDAGEAAADSLSRFAHLGDPVAQDPEGLLVPGAGLPVGTRGRTKRPRMICSIKVSHSPPGDCQEPGAESGAPVELVQLEISSNQDVLAEVSDIVWSGDSATDETSQVLLMQPDQPIKRFALPSLGLENALGIRLRVRPEGRPPTPDIRTAYIRFDTRNLVFARPHVLDPAWVKEITFS